MEKSIIRDNIQKRIDHLQNYKVENENEYCFRVSSNCDSITETLIKMIESFGYDFLHCQIIGEERKLVARFTYK